MLNPMLTCMKINFENTPISQRLTRSDHWFATYWHWFHTPEYRSVEEYDTSFTLIPITLYV